MTDANEVDGTLAAAVRITGGGVPSPEQLAALAVALGSASGGAPDLDGAVAGEPWQEGYGGWTEASRLEGVGFRPFVSVDDLVRYHRSIA